MCFQVGLSTRGQLTPCSLESMAMESHLFDLGKVSKSYPFLNSPVLIKVRCMQTYVSPVLTVYSFEQPCNWAIGVGCSVEVVGIRPATHTLLPA